jgi:NAD(P)H-dependent FMN reductase
MGSVRVAIVNGSPHADGYVSQLVERLGAGVRDGGAEAEVIRLIDYRIEPCLNTPGWPCWPEGACQRAADDTQQVKTIVEAADGLVVACPVYWSSANGLTKNFMDKMRLSGFEGKPALAVTVAGGSGNGMVLAIKAVHGFFGWGYRPLPPLPVCRFNFEKALEDAFARGQAMAEEAAKGPRPFESWAEQLNWERHLPFADWQLLDEKLYLAGLVVENARPGDEAGRKALDEAGAALKEARRLMGAGRADEAAGFVERAYKQGRRAWGEEP